MPGVRNPHHQLAREFPEFGLRLGPENGRFPGARHRVGSHEAPGLAGCAGHGIRAKPQVEWVTHGDGRGRHPPQESPRPSRGTGRAAARISYSAAGALSVTASSRHEIVAPCTDMDEEHFDDVTCLSLRNHDGENQGRESGAG